MALTKDQKAAAAREAAEKVSKAEALAEDEKYEGITGELKAFFAMLRAVIAGEFEVPLATIGLSFLVVGYIVSPIDLIPDLIPGLGQLDDAIVVAGLLVFLNPDVERFQEEANAKSRRRRKRKKARSAVADLPAPARMGIKALAARAAKADLRGDFDGFGGDFKALVAMVSQYAKGNYNNFPLATLILSVVALAYALSPVDIIPDVIPIAGLADDAAVLTTIGFILTKVNPDLEDFKRWYYAGGSVPKGRNKLKGGQKPLDSPTMSGLVGKDTTVYIPGEGRYPIGLDAVYMIVESGDLVSSHKPMARFDPDARYPAGLNPRSYKTKREGDKVRSIARKMPADRLLEVSAGASGQPVAVPEGTALSGNGRAMALGLVYGRPAAYSRQAALYRDELIERSRNFGFDPKAVARMKKPILTRVIRTPLVNDDYMAIAEAFNQGDAGQFPCPPKKDLDRLRDLISRVPEGKSLSTWLQTQPGEISKLRRAGLLPGRLLLRGGMITPVGFAHLERIALCGLFPPDLIAIFSPTERESLAMAIPLLHEMSEGPRTRALHHTIDSAYSIEEDLPEASTWKQTVADIQRHIKGRGEAEFLAPSVAEAFLVVYLRHFATPLTTEIHIRAVKNAPARSKKSPSRILAESSGKEAVRALAAVKKLSGIESTENFGARR